MLDTCNMHLCYFYQKTPVALHLIFNILFNCRPLTDFIVSPTTLSDWHVLLGEADKLISIPSMIFISGAMTPTKEERRGT